MTKVPWPGATVLAATLLGISFYPFLELLRLATSDMPDTREWLSIWINGTFARSLLLTCFASLIASVVAIAASAPFAAAVTFTQFRGKPLVELAALSPMLLAPYVAAGAWSGLDFGGVTHGILAMGAEIGFSCAPLSYIGLRVAFSRLPPSLGEAAASCGLSKAERVVRIWIPLLFTPTVFAAVFAFSRAFGDYGTAERNGLRTFGVAFHDMWNGSQSEHVGAVVALCALVPALIVGLWSAVMSRQRRPRHPPSTHGAQSFQKTPLSGRLLWALWAWCAVCVLVSFVAPEWQEILWCIEGRWMAWSKLVRVCLGAFQSAGLDCAILCAIACMCALVLRPGSKSATAEQSLWLLSVGLFAPPMALAIAWLLATADNSFLGSALGSLRDSQLPVIGAQCVKFAPLAIIPLLDRLARENEGLREALLASTASRMATARHVLAMAMPAILLGGALVFMEALKELEIAITLQNFGFASPAIKIHASTRFHSEHVVASWVLATQALMLPALAVVVGCLARLDKKGGF